MHAAGAALIAVAVIVGILLIGYLLSYNRFVRQRNLVEESWRQIDVELQRRHDLIPNLVETVKGYAAHEAQIFEAVSAARATAMAPGATPAVQARQEDALSASVGRLLAVSEAYPQLKANQGFLQLQGELTETEDRIAAGRRFYNGNVRAMNTRIESLPSSIVAGRMHLAKAEYFETTDAARTPVDVSFGQMPPAP